MSHSRMAPGFQRLVRAAWRERGFGDFWGYTLVADGVAEAMMEPDLHPWDLAVPWILVEGAGGGGSPTSTAGGASIGARGSRRTAGSTTWCGPS